MESKKINLQKRNVISEAVFTASRSSGPGGQHVNKVNTQIELRFNVDASKILREDEKLKIKTVLHSRLSAAGDLIIGSQSERSQLKNKEKAIDKFYTLLSRTLTPRKKRIPTKATAASHLKRLEEKQQRAMNKKLRRNDYSE
jgi:ribosome-associated protein